MKRITKKELQSFIDDIAVIGNSKISEDRDNVYYSKTDGSYLTRVGMESNLKFLLKLGITSEIHCPDGKCANVGFNSIEKKWYGWSHRSIVGFGIGDKLFDEYWVPKGYSKKRDSCEFLTAIENIKFIERGAVIIKNMKQSKQAAVNFAKYIS